MTSSQIPHSRPMLLLNAQYLPASRDWRSSGDKDSPFAVDTFIREAQHAETAGIDAFFQADFSGVSRPTLRAGSPVTVFESFQMAAMVAQATSRIKVMPTISTMHTHPVSFARSLASLDRISGGRAWINIVSSFRSGTGIGSTRTIPSERRHDQTAEFLDVAQRLWASWPPAANTPDKTLGQFIHTDLIDDLNHHGEFYDQPGPIDMPPLSEGFPFTLEATSSLKGVKLAARTADAVFAGTPTLGAAQALRDVLRHEVTEAGRSADALRLLPGVFIQIIDSTQEADMIAAAQRHHQAREFSGPAALTQFHARYPGLNFEDLGPNDQLPASVLPEDPADVLAEHGSKYLPLWDLAYNHGTRTVREFIAEAHGLGEHARFMGTCDQIAEKLATWHNHGGVDGFQFILGNDFDALCERIVPALLERTS